MARLPRRGAHAALTACLIALVFATQASAATFNVDSTEDQVDAVPGNGVCLTEGGQCTLRAAVTEANASPADDTIVLGAERYAVGPVDGDEGEDENESGDFDVTGSGSLMLEGKGTRRTVVSGDGVDRVFDVLSDSDVTITGLTIRDGKPIGSDDFCFCGLLGAEQSETGAGDAGTLAVSPFGPQEQGGGVYVHEDAQADLIDSAVTHSVLPLTGTGGGIANLGDLSLDRTTLNRNAAGEAGGGIVNYGTLAINDSTLSENASGASGGAIANYGGALDVESSTINGNAAIENGGGVYDDGSGDTTYAAGDREGGGDSITNSTIADNSTQTGTGGALYAADGTDLQLTGDTIADNTVIGPTSRDLYFLVFLLQIIGGGGFPLGGGSPADIPIFIGTPADPAGAVYAVDGAGVAFENTIVAESTTLGTYKGCGTNQSAGTPFESLGHNLETGSTCGFGEETDQQEGVNGRPDPKLDELRDNGGPTETMALLEGSDALEAGGNDTCEDTDQRGGNRPLPAGSPGQNCDVGAYEANSLSDLSVDANSDAPDAVQVGSPLTYNVVVRNNGPDLIKGASLNDAVPAGATVDSATSSAGTCSGTGPVTCALGDLAPGQVVRIEVVVRPATAGDVSGVATVSAPGITDTDPGNDSRSTSTHVDAASQPPGQQQQPPPLQTPQDPQEQDRSVQVNLDAPKTATLDEFIGGIVVEADCTDEACLRRFREHAAINTGASHIAGFNLTVSRGSLSASTKKTKFRLKPCQSGSKNGKRHKRCMKNLRAAAKKAGKFKVKVVVSAVDAAGNKDYAKAFTTVGR